MSEEELLKWAMTTSAGKVTSVVGTSKPTILRKEIARLRQELAEAWHTAEEQRKGADSAEAKAIAAIASLAKANQVMEGTNRECPSCGYDRLFSGQITRLEAENETLTASLAKAKEEVGYLVERAMEAEQFCGKICGHRPTDTIREVESEALYLGHALMIALNPFRSSPASPVEKKEGA